MFFYSLTKCIKCNLCMPDFCNIFDTSILSIRGFTIQPVLEPLCALTPSVYVKSLLTLSVPKHSSLSQK